jgi:pyruvate/2-oxoglutarate/acetoin dehydrogenase E1 component
MGVTLKYFDELIKAMDYLAVQPDTLFVGQSVRWDGHALYRTLVNVSDEKRLEMPVVEEFQMGLSTGMALEGIVPVSIFPRWDFLILATSQLVNHLDKIPIVSNGKLKPKVIIRVSVGSTRPLNPGPQHCQDHTEAFKLMLQTVEVIDLVEPEQIVPAYEKAYLRDDGRSTLLVEHMDFYNEK